MEKKTVIIQYSAMTPKGYVQHYLKEVTYAVYQYKYMAAFKSGLITNLEILPL